MPKGACCVICPFTTFHLHCPAAALESSRHVLIFQKMLDSSLHSDLIHQSSCDTLPKNTELCASESTDAIAPAKPLSLHMLLTKLIMISISNYALLSLLDMLATMLIPLVWSSKSTQSKLGGLNLSTASIGLCLSAYGYLNSMLQFAFFPYVIGLLGPGCVILFSIIAYVIIYIMFSFENMAACYAISVCCNDTNTVVWFFVILQLASICFTDMGFSKFSQEK
jgi:hypothetical protein